MSSFRVRREQVSTNASVKVGEQPATSTVVTDGAAPPARERPSSGDVNKAFGLDGKTTPNATNGSLGFDEVQTMKLEPSQAPEVQHLVHGSPGQPPEGTLIVFGGTGDLAAVGAVRDALVGLSNKGGQGGFDPNRNPVVLLAGRRTVTLDEHVAHMAEGRGNAPLGDSERAKLRALVESSANEQGQLGRIDLEADPDVVEKQLEHLVGSGSAVAYAALPPATFDEFLSGLKAAGFDKPQADGTFRRLVLEKPLGTSPEHARQLARYINENFAPGQVLLVDHFLPMLTNILAVRTNPVLDAALSNQNAQAVRVFMDEKIGSNDRPYFRDTGLLLDVVQNHVLMMLASMTGDLPPADELTAEAVRKGRAEVLQNIVIDPSTAKKGQFEGFNDAAEGAPVDSKTGQVTPSNAETFVTFDFEVKTPRWQGVPFSVEATKGGSRDRWGVEVDLKLTRELAQLAGVAPGTKATLRALIRPEQEITLVLEGGRTFELPIADDKVRHTSPYERLFADALKGDSALFNSVEEPLASWENVVAPVQKALAQQSLFFYPRGTDPS